MAYNRADPTRELLFMVEEMEFVERLIVKETSRAAEQTNNDSAKETFSRWARESEMHSKTLQRVAEKLRGKAASKPSIRGLGMIDLRDVSLMHLSIEGDAERRYSQMAAIADDNELRETFTSLAKAENKHHREAQLLSQAVNQLIEEGITRGKQ